MKKFLDSYFTLSIQANYRLLTEKLNVGEHEDLQGLFLLLLIGPHSEQREQPNSTK